MFITIVIIIVVLSLLIFIHELGHFASAKINGVAVEEFGIGFPPRLFKFKGKKTTYSINLIPIGGFVKIKGEMGENKEDKDSYSNKNFWQKFSILFSGVGMNIVLAIVLLSVGFMIGLPTVLDDSQMNNSQIKNRKVQISSVYENSAAEQSGIMIGDSIRDINGQVFNNVSEVQQFIAQNQENTLTVDILRGKEEISTEITPSVVEGQGDDKIMGVTLVNTGIIKYNFFKSVAKGFITAFSLLWAIIYSFYQLIVGTIPLGAISGPVGIVVLTSQISKLGLIYILQFTAILSLNLVILNVLPLPALDGGRIIFLLFEKIRGKPNNEKIETMVHNIGFIFLILILIVITYKDFLKYGGSIVSGINNLF